VLLPSVAHPLHPFSGTVDSSIKGALPTLSALPWDDDPDAMLSAIVSDHTAAVAFGTHEAVGTALGPPAPRPLDGSLGHQMRQDGGLMPVARRQDKGHACAVAFGADVDCDT
jgi:hypothetical protein